MESDEVEVNNNAQWKLLRVCHPYYGAAVRELLLHCTVMYSPVSIVLNPLFNLLVYKMNMHARLPKSLSFAFGSGLENIY